MTHTIDAYRLTGSTARWIYSDLEVEKDDLLPFLLTNKDENTEGTLIQVVHGSNDLNGYIYFPMDDKMILLDLRETDLKNGSKGLEAFMPTWLKLAIGDDGLELTDRVMLSLDFDFLGEDIEVSTDISEDTCDRYCKIIRMNEFKDRVA